MASTSSSDEKSTNIRRYLGAMNGQRIFVETMEGGRRTGVLTNVRERTIRCGGNECKIPTELVLNGDESDPIPFGSTIAIGRVL